MLSGHRSDVGFRFGVFELSRTTGNLSRNGVPVRLPPQPAQVLLLLVERAGEVVTREEIQRLAWGDGTVVDFEIGINRCIRRIRSALLDDADAPRYLETVPRVGYRFIAPVESSSATTALPDPIPHPDLPASPPPLPVPRKPAAWKAGTLAALLSAAALAAILWLTINWFTTGRQKHPTDLQPVPLAVSLGDQFTPTFSPDGRQVAFTWNGEGQDNFDIYLKLVNSSSPTLRLTTNRDVDYSPAWSPDGQWIAFCRGTDTPGGAIWIVPALGGAERKIVDIHELASPWNRSIAWSRDSKHLVVSAELAGEPTKGLHLIDISTGLNKQITMPDSSEVDMHPAVSPDGTAIAFTRDVGRGISRIFVIPFSGGTPRAIPAPQSSHVYNARPAWTPDGTHIAFVSNAGGDSHVWLSSATNSSKSEELAALGGGIQDTVVSAVGQLGLVLETEESNIWTVDLHRSSATERLKPKRIFASTRVEESPAVRADGRQIAFASNRSGYGEIWTGRTDGTDLTQITYLQNPVTGSPDWSPDGGRIVFDSRAGERPQLYTASADGGMATPLPSGNGMSVVPHWSPDGRYIYFSSDRTGRMEIWRIPSTGGSPEQITKTGGFAGVSSPNGEFLYYSSDNEPITSLWELRFDTRKSVLIAPSVLRRAYAPAPDGVYFFTGSTSSDESTLFFLDNRSHQQTVIFNTDRRIGSGVTLAPDGHTLYYTQIDVSGHQLMLVQNFWK